MTELPGPIVLFGSGETAPNGRKVYEWVFSRLKPPVRLAVLETPAGFQPNSATVAGKIADAIKLRLQNYQPYVTLVPARRRDTKCGTDDPDVLAPLLEASAIFLGPGSPTYAARHLSGSLASQYLAARHRLGVPLIMASAATIASGVHALPVYEIYKVGDDLHWAAGLNLLGPYGLSLTFIPHWNNTEGGAELDTSRCYMGKARFARLLDLLPDYITVVGIDEHTALAIDLSQQSCRVIGRGGVVVLRGGENRSFVSGEQFAISILGPYRLPSVDELVPEAALRKILNVAADAGEHDESAQRAGPPNDVLELARARARARSRQAWGEADQLRERIAALGWQVIDDVDGTRFKQVADTSH